MKRIKLTVAYDGTHYSGWQIQPNATTIERVLDDAILALTGEKIHVTGASRTDAGVHAMGNVAVFDTQSTIPGNRFAYAINRYLPEDVCVQSSKQVHEEFHPRHCNTVKTYEYKILNTTFAVPQLRKYTWHVPYTLDLEKMRNASKYLIGEHDFKSFCCVRTQTETTVRNIYSIELLCNESLQDTEGKIITIRIKGNGFLYNMVRIIAGTLMMVGRGQIKPETIKEMLEGQDRTLAGQTAPPQGLTLMNIDYVDKDDEEWSDC